MHSQSVDKNHRTALAKQVKTPLTHEIHIQEREAVCTAQNPCREVNDLPVAKLKTETYIVRRTNYYEHSIQRQGSNTTRIYANVQNILEQEAAPIELADLNGLYGLAYSNIFRILVTPEEFPLLAQISSDHLVDFDLYDSQGSVIHRGWCSLDRPSTERQCNLGGYRNNFSEFLDIWGEHQYYVENVTVDHGPMHIVLKIANRTGTRVSEYWMNFEIR